MSTKELALDTIQGLPESASWPEIEERIRFVAAVEQARQEVRDGRSVPHEEVGNLLQGWTSK